MSGVNLLQPVFAAWERHPEKMALRIPRLQGQTLLDETTLSYGELRAEVGRYQQALQALGLRSGDRVLVLSRVRQELYVLMLALLALGLVPVLIDRGMSKARMRAAIRLSGARTAIGEVGILRFWWLFAPLWRMRRLAFDGRCLGVSDLRRQLPVAHAPILQLLPATAHGLITYTSGSTGLPKGADRTHGSLMAQHHAIRAHWQDHPDDRDCPSFPVLVLHNLCCGLSTVLPRIDLATPGQFDAAALLQQLQDEGITRLSAAPAFMQRLCEHALQHGLLLPRVRAVAIGGSTLPQRLLDCLPAVFPQAQVLGVYGSTEAEPIADITLEELRRDGDLLPGYLLGLPVASAQVCIVPTEIPLADDQAVQAARCAPRVIGEILVSGAHVLQAYVDNPQATAESKIRRADGSVWHRTGDAGCFDEQGRLWLAGRLKDCLTLPGQTLWPYPLEKQLDALPGVRRSAALVWQQQLLLVIEGHCDTASLQAVLQPLALSKACWVSVPQMPVDGRHNSKIDRPQLLHGLQQGHLRPQLLELP